MKLYKNQQGNVLFLILIAVALFAALSFVVTQSTRGGGDPGSETNRLNLAGVTQFAAGLRTAVTRMVLAGTAASTITFDRPGDAGYSSSEETQIFAVAGGAQSYQQGPASVGTSGAEDWFFTGQYEIRDVGTTAVASPTNASNDIIALLPNLTTEACTAIQEELYGNGATVPTLTATLTPANLVDSAELSTLGAPIGLETSATPASDDMRGLAFGCFIDGGGTNYYFHVLAER